MRTGPGMRECEKIIESIEHFYVYIEMECCDRMGLCLVDILVDIRKIWNIKKKSLWNFVTR